MSRSANPSKPKGDYTMSRLAEPICLVIAVAALIAWAWFWTGPELRWEHQLQTSEHAALGRSDGR